MISLPRIAAARNLGGRFLLDLFRTRPSFQFYPDDWQSDSALGTCSAAARGVWVELLCLMHQGEPYGHLTINGQAPSDAMIARCARLNLREVSKGIAELETAGVFQRTPTGTIFSARMVRDEDRRQVKAEAGKLGAEFGARAIRHPNASRPGDARAGGRPPKPPIEPPSTPDIGTRQKPPPSSSSSSSSSNDVDVGDNHSKSDLEVRLRAAGLIGRQIRMALGRGIQCAEACLAYLDSPPDEAQSPIKVIGARLRDGDPIPPPKVGPPAPISPEDRAKYGAIAQERVLAKHPNLRGAGLSVSLTPAIDREIRALLAQEAQCGAA